MNTTQILAHYRIAVLHDADLTYLLAHLFRLGPQSKETLAQQLRQDQKALGRQLARLYRAALVHRLPAGTWVVSRAAEHVLQSMDIHEAAAKDLLRTFSYDEEDQNFLGTCIAAANNHGQGDTYFCMLRGLSLVHFAFHGQSEELEPPATRAALYALMFGADDEVRLLGTSDVTGIESVAEGRMRLALTTAGSRPTSSISPALREIIHQDCSRAVELYANSNKALMQLESLSTSVNDKAMLRTVLARVLSGAIWSRPDPDLARCSRRWTKEDYGYLWRTTLSHQGHWEKVATALREWTGQTATTFNELVNVLSTLLRESISLLGKQQEAMAQPPLGQLNAHNTGKAHHAAIGFLRAALASIRSVSIYQYDKDIAEIREILEELRQELDVGEPNEPAIWIEE